MKKEIPVKDLPDAEIAWCECGDAMPKELKICVNCQFVKDMMEKEIK